MSTRSQESRGRGPGLQVHTGSNASHAAQQPCGPGLPGAFPFSGNRDEDLCPELQGRSQGLQSHTPASGQGLERVSQGSCHCQFRSGTLGTQLGSITEWVPGKFERPGSAFPKPCKPLKWGPRCGFGLSVIWPENRQVRHRPQHTGCSPASAGVDAGGRVSCLLCPCVHSTRVPPPGPGVLSVDPLLCKQASGWSAPAAFQKVPRTRQLE